jgi:hypothetical protein
LSIPSGYDGITWWCELTLASGFIFWLTGDFNLPDISWKHNISGNQNALGLNDAFLTLVEDIGLQQMIDFPTRNNATLDLFLTNRPLNAVRA